MSRKPHFAFVLSLLDITFDLPVEVIAGYVLKKADPDQVGEVKRVIGKMSRLPGSLRYEMGDPVPTSEGPGSTGVLLRDIPEAQHRYFVIEMSGNNSRMHDLALAGLISPVQINCSLSFLYWREGSSPGWSGRFPALYSFIHGLSDPPWEPAVAFTRQDLSEWQEVYSRMIEVGNEHPDIKRSIRLLESLQDVPQSSSLYILGLFAVLESAITHEPREGAGDSLSHQVSTKMPLLQRRFDRQIEITEFFKPCDSVKLWKKLYKYRSAIAHGDEMSFTGEQAVLQSKDAVLKFMSRSVAATLRTALREPQLVKDLKAC